MMLLPVLLTSFFISTALACNGYEVKDLSVQMCDGKDAVLSLDNFSAEMKDDCTIVCKGCIIVKKQVDWGNGTYLVEKKDSMGMPMKFTGKKDLCKLLEESKGSPDVELVFKMLTLEQKCPLKAGKICGNKEGVSVAKYKDKMSIMKGKYEGKIEGQSSAGPVCIKIGMEIAQKGGSGGGAPSFPKMG